MKIKNPVFVTVLSIIGVVTFAVVYIFTLNKKYIGFVYQGKPYNLLTARNDAEWTRGLMFVKTPVSYDGMMFYFPGKSKRTFWNMNTLMDLDVIWLDGDKIIGKSFLPSVTKSGHIVTVSSPGPADKVVELIRK